MIRHVTQNVLNPITVFFEHMFEKMRKEEGSLFYTLLFQKIWLYIITPIFWAFVLPQPVLFIEHIVHNGKNETYLKLSIDGCDEFNHYFHVILIMILLFFIICIGSMVFILYHFYVTTKGPEWKKRNYRNSAILGMFIFVLNSLISVFYFGKLVMIYCWPKANPSLFLYGIIAFLIPLLLLDAFLILQLFQNNRSLLNPCNVYDLNPSDESTFTLEDVY